MIDLSLMSNPINEKTESSIYPELEFEDYKTQNVIFSRYNEIYYINPSSKLLNNKRFKDSYTKYKKSSKKHTKYSYDNLKRECKHLVIENVMKFINNKIYEIYEGNIGNGLNIKRLLKLNQSQKTNADVEFNKLFITKSLKEIFSQDITKQIKLYSQDHNKKVIEKLIEEKKENFENLFNLTFIDCVEHFIGNKNIVELNGLILFSELKEQIISKYDKDGETYYETLRLFLQEFENKIKRAKPRRKKKKAYK